MQQSTVSSLVILRNNRILDHMETYSEHLIWAADNECIQFPAKHPKTRLIKDLSCYHEYRVEAQLLQSMKIVSALWPKKKTAFGRTWNEEREWVHPAEKWQQGEENQVNEKKKPWKEWIMFSFCTFLWSLKTLNTHKPNVKLSLMRGKLLEINPPPLPLSSRDCIEPNRPLLIIMVLQPQVEKRIKNWSHMSEWLFCNQCAQSNI